MWLLAAAVVAAGAVGVLLAVARLSREVDPVVEAFAALGRELRPELIRVRSATEQVQTRTPEP
jgi:hypothetical protein